MKNLKCTFKLLEMSDAIQETKHLDFIENCLEKFNKV